MPISDDENLLKLQDQAEEYLREAKRRNPSEPDELISTIIDAVSRKSFHFAVRKKTVIEVSNNDVAIGPTIVCAVFDMHGSRSR